MTSLGTDDILEIHELLGRYGHIIDERRWDELDRLFTADAVFDASDFGESVTTSLDQLRRVWSAESTPHPVAHHATNIVIEDDDGAIRVASKGLGILRDGRVASVVYRDELRKTPAGWRLARRTAVRRRG